MRKSTLLALTWVVQATWALTLSSPLAAEPAPPVALPPHAEHHQGHHQPHHHAHHQHRFHSVDWSVRAFEDPKREAWQKPDKVVAALGLQPGQTAVDIGASTGYFARRMALMVGAHGHVIGLDIEGPVVDYLNARARREGLTALVARKVAPDHAGLAPASVDCILIVDTIHHIDNRPSYLRELRRALRPGGKLAIVDFRADREVPFGPPKSMRIPEGALRDELRAAGFGSFSSLGFLEYQYFLIAR
jgi:SAM-dependent methyltransferase